MNVWLIGVLTPAVTVLTVMCGFFVRRAEKHRSDLLDSIKALVVRMDGFTEKLTDHLIVAASDSALLHQHLNAGGNCASCRRRP